MNRKFFVIVWLMLCLLSSTMVFASKSVAGEAAPPTSPLAPPTTAGGVLPDALYFLNERGQIARLEADGRTLTTITHEAEPVDEFAVAPDGTRLAYSTANRLIESDALGNKRIVKVQGPAFDPTNYQQGITQRLRGLLYTPDGKGITFGLNGIKQIASGEGSDAIQVLMANDPFPDSDQSARADAKGANFVWPVAWSPNGRWLLVRHYNYDSDLFGLRVLDATAGLQAGGCPDQPSSATWSRDGQSLLCVVTSYWTDLVNQLYISRVDPVSGAETVLIGDGPPNTPAAPITIGSFRSIFERGDGSFLLFSNQQSGRRPPTADLFLALERYTMQQMSADGGQITPLRSDVQRLAGDLLWARDGSGAVISDASTANAGAQAAPLLWLPSDGSPVVELMAVGHQMQWRTTIAEPTANTATTAVTATTATTTAVANGVKATLVEMASMYSSPGLDAAISGRLPGGTVVTITGRTGAAPLFWWQILYPPDSAERVWISGNARFREPVSPTQTPLVAASPVQPILTAVSRHTIAEGSNVQFSPDGALFATLVPDPTQGGAWLVKLWRTADGVHVGDFPQTAYQLPAVAIAPNNQWLATVATDPEKQGIKIWQVADGTLVEALSIDGLAVSFKSVTFSPDGTMLAVGGNLPNDLDGTVWIFDTTTWALRKSLPTPGQAPTVVTFSPDGRLLITAGFVQRFHAGPPNSVVRLWRVGDWQLQQELREGKLGILQVAVAPDNQSLAYAFCHEAVTAFVFACLQGGVTVARLSDGAPIAHFDEYADAIAFSPDGQWLALGALLGDTVRFLRTDDWSHSNRLPITARALAFAADGNYLATNDYQQAQLWSFNTK